MRSKREEDQERGRGEDREWGELAGCAGGALRLVENGREGGSWWMSIREAEDGGGHRDTVGGRDRRGERQEGRRGKDGNLREGEGHQSTTNHYKVQDVPQVTEIGSLMQNQTKVHHLQGTQERERDRKSEKNKEREEIRLSNIVMIS